MLPSMKKPPFSSQWAPVLLRSFFYMAHLDRPGKVWRRFVLSGVLRELVATEKFIMIHPYIVMATPGQTDPVVKFTGES